MTKVWAALEAISAFLGVIRDFFSWKKSADDRQAGADAATVSGQKREDAALIETQDAIDDADNEPIEYRD